MAALPSRYGLAALAAVLIGATYLPPLVGWIAPDRMLELSALALGGMLTACLAVQRRAAADRAIMPPGFVIIVIALLLFGPHVATAIAAAVALTPGLIAARMPRRQILIDTAIIVLATQSAGLAFESARDVVGRADWPWLAVALAAAVVAYHL